MLRRVVISGMGIISPVGIGTEENWNAIVSGNCGSGLISSFDTSSFPTKIGAEIKYFDLGKYIANKKILKILCKADIFGLVAAHMAYADSGLQYDSLEPERGGVFLGSGKKMEILERIFESIQFSLGTDGHISLKKLGVEAKDHIHPLLLLQGLPNGCLFAISSTFRLKGDNCNIMASGTASSQAIGHAFRSIQRGDADYVIAGGFDSGINWITLSTFSSLGLLSQQNAEPKKAYRPFDLRRDGFVIGEGAGVIMLEELSHALERGAKIYAEVAGYAASFDVFQLLNPRSDGSTLVETIIKALIDAKMNPEEIDYINADGSGTQLGDKIETQAIKRAFGTKASKISISTTKPVTGHLLEAAGGVELIATVMAMNDNIIPPTINYHHRDVDCDLDYTPNEAKTLPIKAALSINRGISGQNAVLVIKKFMI